VSEAVLEHHGHDHGHDAHAHHLAGPSWWPMILAVGIGIMGFGFASSFSGPRMGGVVMGMGLATMFVGMGRWWYEMVSELNTTPEAIADQGHDQVEKDQKLSFLLFIGSEVMFFAAFFAYYFYCRATAEVWPPAGTKHIEVLLPTINTLLLISSGAAFNWAEMGLKKDSRIQLKNGILLAVILGTIFLGLQGYEYAHMEMTLKTNTLSTAFYLLTGFHGAHVIVGVIMLTICYFRALNGHFTKHRHTGLQLSGWYWHFVDVVWIFLYFVLYLW
jgi:cytochrome c oxidase subunit III